MAFYNILNNHFETLAEQTLALFSKVATAAKAHMSASAKKSGAEAFASINTFTSTAALRSQEIIHHDNLEACRVLSAEPAIARVVVVDEDENRKIYGAVPDNRVLELSWDLCARAGLADLNRTD
jgi:hypothetical protein